MLKIFRTKMGLLFALVSGAVLVLSISPAQAASGDLYENLQPLQDSEAALVEIDPRADFSVYRRVALLDTHVAFRSGWERDQKRPGSRIGISKSEVQKIKSDVAALFTEVFSEVLSADGGYEIVTESGDDVLLLRPSIIDLDISVPDMSSSYASRTYANQTGSATLYIELFDSVSGQILGRAADRQTVRRPDTRFTWNNTASNRSDAAKLFETWAQALRDFLDEHYRD
jgi:hypothetical protein